MAVGCFEREACLRVREFGAEELDVEGHVFWEGEGEVLLGCKGFADL